MRRASWLVCDGLSTSTSSVGLSMLMIRAQLRRVELRQTDVGFLTGTHTDDPASVVGERGFAAGAESGNGELAYPTVLL